MQILGKRKYFTAAQVYFFWDAEKVTPLIVHVLCQRVWKRVFKVTIHEQQKKMILYMYALFVQNFTHAFKWIRLQKEVETHTHEINKIF